MLNFALMKHFKFHIFENQKQTVAFFDKIQESYEIFKPWFRDNTIKIYGYLQAVFPDSTYTYYLFVFGKVSKIRAKVNFQKDTVNSDLFHPLGLKDIQGETILSNEFYEITFFKHTYESDLFLVRKIGRYGLFKESNPFSIIAEPKYERIFDAHEYTIGFVHDKKVGFMDINGNVVIQPMLSDIEGYNIFKDGKARVVAFGCDPYNCECYIDHYGNEVQSEYNLFESEGPSPEYLEMIHHKRDSNYDAYEGDSSNRWNND